MARPRDDIDLHDVVQTLEREIIFGAIMPRQRLIEDEIIERFAMTRHRARRILDELVRKGLVRHVPKKGAIVRDFTEQEIEELYDMRLLLQGAAIRKLSFPFDAQAISELQDMHARHLDAGKKDDLLALFEANNAFHARIFAEAGDETLQDAIEDYARRTHPVRSQGFADKSYLAAAQADHAAMIAAVAIGDWKVLAQVDREHVRRPKERYLSSTWRMSLVVS